MAPLAIGTETNSSVVCSSSADGVVGIKPTVGLPIFGSRLSEPMLVEIAYGCERTAVRRTRAPRATNC